MFKIFLKIFSISLILSSLIFISFSTNYADLKIDLQNDGSVTINSDSNLNEFKNITNSQKFTSKNKKYWIFNLSSINSYEDFIYELNLPINAKINYIKTTPTFRIETGENSIKIIGTGSNKPINILIQYSFNNKLTNIVSYVKNDTFRYLFYFALLVLFISLIIIFDLMFRDKNKNLRPDYVEKKIEVKKEKVLISILSQRQQDIINILKENKKITQKELENIMKIPKSSISRNVKTLEIKGYIIKNGVGVTNYLSLNNEFEFE